MIVEIFEKYATGNYPMPDLHRLLVEAGSSSRSSKVLEKMLSNPFYYGAMPVKNKVLQGCHEPLVSKELWDACQKIRGIRAAQYAPNSKKRAVLKPFMGLMTCASCYHRITGEAVTNTYKRIYVYYRCANRDCPNNKRRVPQDEVHAQLNEVFKSFERFTPKAMEAFCEIMQNRMEDSGVFARRSVNDFFDETEELNMVGPHGIEPWTFGV